MLDKAIRIAATIHEGQVDKAGQPYILHPLRVMFAMETDLEKICAVFHDVIEDSDLTLEALRKQGFSDEVLSVLDALSKRENESYEDFISRVLLNKTACRVKLADLKDNMDLSRIANPSEIDYQRFEKYRKATDRILQALSNDTGNNEILPDQ